MFGLDWFSQNRSSDSPRRMGAGHRRNRRSQQLLRAGGYEEQQRLLTPDMPGLDIPTAVPRPVPEPEQETVDITVVDDSDFVGKLVALTRRGEIKDFSDVTEMVDRVLARAAGKKIRVLNIWDHGSPGYQSIGDEWLGFNTHAKPFQELARLTSHFASDGQVVLHGCRAAKGPNGPKLLAYLSQMWRVPVRASEVLQRAIPGTGLMGTTVECTPEAGDQWLDEWVGEMRGQGSSDAQPDCDRDPANKVVDNILDRDYLSDVKKLNPWPHIKKAKFW